MSLRRDREATSTGTNPFPNQQRIRIITIRKTKKDTNSKQKGLIWFLEEDVDGTDLASIGKHMAVLRKKCIALEQASKSKVEVSVLVYYIPTLLHSSPTLLPSYSPTLLPILLLLFYFFIDCMRDWRINKMNSTKN